MDTLISIFPFFLTDTLKTLQTHPTLLLQDVVTSVRLTDTMGLSCTWSSLSLRFFQLSLE